MNEEVFDVIMLSTGNFHASIQTFQEHHPPNEDFGLTDELWVGQLPNGVSSDLVFEACDSPGWNFHPVRQYGMRYAFCRKVEPTHETYYQWDQDHMIGSAVLLSRFIHPTTIGSSLTAKLYFRDGVLQSIVPGPTQSKCSHSWVVAETTWRDWLSIPELQQLRALLPHYIVNAPTKVRLARKHADNAFYAYFLDERFASLVTAFESLLKTSRNELTEQFKTRAAHLAEMLQMQLSREDLHNTYAHRSDFVHGSIPDFEKLASEANVQLPEEAEIHPNLIGRYNRCEAVLRRALLRASTEPEFAALFSSNETIEKAFGKPVKQIPDAKRAAIITSLSNHELKTECVRRYGATFSFEALRGTDKPKNVVTDAHDRD